MSRFSDQDKARVLAESRRILNDAPPPRRPEPEPVREVHIPAASDPVAEWRDWHDDRAAEREAAKAELRREEGDAARVLSALGRIAALEARVAETERLAAQSDEMMHAFAKDAADFSCAVNGILERVDKQFAELGTKLSELRALDDVRRRGEVIDLPDFRRRAN